MYQHAAPLSTRSPNTTIYLDIDPLSVRSKVIRYMYNELVLTNFVMRSFLPLPMTKVMQSLLLVCKKYQQILKTFSGNTRSEIIQEHLFRRLSVAGYIWIQEFYAFLFWERVACVSMNNIAENVWTDFDEIVKIGRKWYKKLLIWRFVVVHHLDLLFCLILSGFG